MTTAEQMTDAQIAQRLYPSAPPAAEPVSHTAAEDAALSRKLYPNSQTAEPRKRPALEQAEPMTDEQRAFYGGEPKPKPAAWRETRDPNAIAEADDADVEVTPEDLAEAEASDPPPRFVEADYDSEVLASFRHEARTLGVDATAAQKLLERVAPKLAERQVEQLNALRDQWVEQARADAEIARGEGFDANVKTARGVIRQFGSDELRELLDSSGIGDHPALIRFILRIGRRLSGARG